MCVCVHLWPDYLITCHVFQMPWPSSPRIELQGRPWPVTACAVQSAATARAGAELQNIPLHLLSHLGGL